MSNKQSYAAVVAKPAQEAGDSGGVGSSGQQGEAPPPYTAPSAQPHQTYLPPQPHQVASQHPYQGTTDSYHPTAESGWTPAPTPGVAKSRALRRFWMAFLYAWLIWIAIGLLIGGGISDIESSPPGRHGHWDKHGDWHGDKWSVSRLISKGAEETSE